MPIERYIKLKLVFHSDPGHAWLSVPIERIAQLEILTAISGYSYFDTTTNHAFLEEDCDAGKFMNAAKANGWELEIIEDIEDRDSWIRELPSYPWAGKKPRHAMHGSTQAMRGW